MAEYNLAILLTAKDQASRVLRAVNGELSKTGRVANGASRAFNNAAKGFAVGAGIFAGAVAVGIRNGLETLAARETLLTETANALEQAGLSARVAAADVAEFSNALEGAIGAAVDDKEIQAAANILIRFGNVSAETWQRATTAAVDLGAAMRTGPEDAAKQLAKALADPIRGLTALRRAGVVLNKAEEDRIKDLVKSNRLQEAQNELLTALERKVRGAAAASQGPYARAIAVWTDTVEDAQAVLAEGFLPLLTKLSDKLSKALGDKETMTNIRNFGRGLANAFDKALDIAEDIPWGTIGDGLKMAADWAGKLFGVFRSLPPEVQTTIIALAGLNKLTGGAITGVVSELGKGLIKGVLGMTAGVVHAKAGVVNVSGPQVPGPGGKNPPVPVGDPRTQKPGQPQPNRRPGIQLPIPGAVAFGPDPEEVKAQPEFKAMFEKLTGKQAESTRVLRTHGGMLDRLTAEQRAVKNVTAAGLAAVRASINAKSFAPKITIPVYLRTQVSARNIITTQKTIARFGQMTHL